LSLASGNHPEREIDKVTTPMVTTPKWTAKSTG
jgi:hypothetical protein